MFDRASTFGEALDDPDARAILERYLPGVAASPMATQFRGGRLGQLVAIVPALEDLEVREQFFAALAAVGSGAGRPPYAPAITPDPAYEGDDVARASATMTLPTPTPLWDPLELQAGNPDIPESWSMTSDSLALWLAGLLGAEHLVLLKSAEPPARLDPESLTAQGLVDAAFPAFARSFPGTIHLLGPSSDLSGFGTAQEFAAA